MKKMKNSLLISIGAPVVIILIVIIVIFFSFHHSSLKAHQMKVSINQSINYQQSPFSLAELTSLKNYSFILKTDNSTFSGSVDSPNNWSLQEPVLEEHINNYIYTELGSKWFQQPAGKNNYSQSPYITTAQDFVNLYQAKGSKLSKGASCQINHVNGTIYSFASPTVDKKYLTVLASACIANQGHYLLAYNLGSSLNFQLNNLQKGTSLTYAFQITSINQTKPLVAPSNFQKD